MNAPLDATALPVSDKPAQNADDPLWYKDAIIYQLHVKAFRDSNGDGIGDFPGLTESLDYIADLGVNTVWLLPFYPSPLRDDGYDIADYHGVHPHYGTRADFRHFVREAHRRSASRHHRAGHQPHVRPAPVVPGRARGAAGLRQARLLRVERHRHASGPRRASSSPTPRSRTGPGTRWPRPTTGTASSRISRTSTSTTRASCAR